MTLAEALETTRIDRVPGLTGDCTALVTTRPILAPHHTLVSISSGAAIVGLSPPVPFAAQVLK